MLNTLHILRTSGTTAGDCWGGAPSMSADNGLQPWIESDTLGCVNVLSITPSTDALCRWEIVGNGAGAYKINDLDTVAVAGSYTAVALGVPTTLYASSGTDDYGLYATIVVDTGAHAAGTLTGRTIRKLNLPESEVSAAGYEYRCYELYADGGAEIITVTVTGCTYNLTAVNPAGNQPVSASGTTEPTGVTAWSTTGAESRTLTNGDACYLWLRTARSATPGRAVATAEITYTDGGSAENSVIVHQAWLQYDESLAGYGIGVGYADGLDLSEAAASFSALPETIDITESLSLDERRSVYAVNKYGLTTQARFVYIPFSIDADGVDLNAPAAPTGVTAEDIGGGVLRVQATWQPTEAWTRLHQWKVKYSSNIVTETVTTVTAGSVGADGYYRLDTQLPAGIWGDVYSVSVAAVSAGITGAYAATTGLPTIVSAVSDVGVITLQSSGQIVQATHPSAFTDYLSLVHVYQEPGSVVVQDSSGATLWTVSASLLKRGIHFTGQRMHNIAPGGTGDDPIIYDGTFYLCAGGNRVAMVHPYYLEATSFGTVTTHCPNSGIVVETADSVYWQIFDLTANQWRTYMRVDSDGTLAFGMGILQA